MEGYHPWRLLRPRRNSKLATTAFLAQNRLLGARTRAGRRWTPCQTSIRMSGRGGQMVRTGHACLVVAHHTVLSDVLKSGSVFQSGLRHRSKMDRFALTQLVSSRSSGVARYIGNRRFPQRPTMLALFGFTAKFCYPASRFNGGDVSHQCAQRACDNSRPQR
jgi:hypothetical protein